MKQIKIALIGNPNCAAQHTHPEQKPPKTSTTTTNPTKETLTAAKQQCLMI